jgi:starch phosphorylase
MRITEGLGRARGQQVSPSSSRTRRPHQRFKYFREAGEESVPRRFWVSRSSIAVSCGSARGPDDRARTFSDDDVRMFAMAGVQLAPIVNEARSLGHFVAPVHQRLATLARNLWWSWDDDTTSLFRELDQQLWRESDHNPIVLLRQMSIGQIEARASALALHGRINHVYRRMQEYLQSKHSGARATPACSAPASRSTSRPSSGYESIHLLGRPRDSRRRSSQARRTSEFARGRRAVLRPGARQRLDDAGWLAKCLNVDSGILPIQPAMRDNAPSPLGS